MLKLEIAVLQPDPEERLVMVTSVGPIFNVEVKNVPVPGLPAVKIIVPDPDIVVNDIKDVKS